MRIHVGIPEKLVFVNTVAGRGRLLDIDGDVAYVEMDFMYVVKLPVSQVDLAGAGLSSLGIAAGTAPPASAAPPALRQPPAYRQSSFRQPLVSR